MNFYICRTCKKIADIQGNELKAGNKVKPMSECGRNLHSWVHAELATTEAQRKVCRDYQKELEAANEQSD